MDNLQAQQIFILRCWCESDGSWRFVIENPYAGEQHGFAALPQAIQFLQLHLEKAEAELTSD